MKNHFQYDYFTLCNMKLNSENDRCTFYYDLSDNSIFYITNTLYREVMNLKTKEPSVLLSNILFFSISLALTGLSIVLKEMINEYYLLFILVVYILTVPLQLFLVIEKRKKEMLFIKRNATFVNNNQENLNFLFEQGKKKRTRDRLQIIVFIFCILIFLLMYKSEKRIDWILITPFLINMICSIIVDSFPKNRNEVKNLIKNGCNAN